MGIRQRVLGVKVEYNGNVFKTEGDKLYARMFGTTGPGQKPHWSWGEISKTSPLGQDVMQYIKGLNI